MAKSLTRKLQVDNVIHLKTDIGHLHGWVTFYFEIYLEKIVGFQWLFTLICCVLFSFFQVKHSQRLSETPTSTWIITEVGGKIVSAHCNCMAGLGESCSHVGAMLFYVEAAVRLRESKTVTEEKANWMLPAAHKDIEYKDVVDIDFTAPKHWKPDWIVR